MPLAAVCSGARAVAAASPLPPPSRGAEERSALVKGLRKAEVSDGGGRGAGKPLSASFASRRAGSPREACGSPRTRASSPGPAVRCRRAGGSGSRGRSRGREAVKSHPGFLRETAGRCRLEPLGPHGVARGGGARAAAEREAAKIPSLWAGAAGGARGPGPSPGVGEGRRGPAPCCGRLPGSPALPRLLLGSSLPSAPGPAECADGRCCSRLSPLSLPLLCVSFLLPSPFLPSLLPCPNALSPPFEVNHLIALRRLL